MREQASHIYRRVESSDIVNVDSLKQGIDQEQWLSIIDDTSGDTNQYRNMIVNNKGNTDTVLLQMEQWSVLSNTINYIQYDKHPKNFHSLSISTVNKGKGREKSYTKGEKKSRLELRLWKYPRQIKGGISGCV